MAEDRRRDWSQGFRSNADAAAGCQYIRWLGNGKREHGNALAAILIGVNSIAVSVDSELEPEDLVRILEAEAETFAALLLELRRTKRNYGAKLRRK